MSQASKEVVKKILQKAIPSQTKQTTTPHSDITKLLDSESHEFNIVHSADRAQKYQRYIEHLVSTYGGQQQQQTAPQEQIPTANILTEVQRAQATIKRVKSGVYLRDYLIKYGMRQMQEVFKPAPSKEDWNRQIKESTTEWNKRYGWGQAVQDILNPMAGKGIPNIGDLKIVGDPPPTKKEREPIPGPRYPKLPQPPEPTQPDTPAPPGEKSSKSLCSMLDKNSEMYKKLCGLKGEVRLRA